MAERLGFDATGVSARPWTPDRLLWLAAWDEPSVTAMAGALAGLLTAPEIAPGLAALGPGIRLFPVAPRRWLLVADAAGPDLPPVGGDFAVAPCTGAFAGLTLDGPHSRDVLAKLLPIDLHRAAFPADGFATTRLEGVAVHLHRAGADRFDLLVPASYADFVRFAVTDAAVEFGAPAPLHRPPPRLSAAEAGFG